MTVNYFSTYFIKKNGNFGFYTKIMCTRKTV